MILSFNEYAREWMRLKEQEANIIKYRRVVEDEMRKMAELDDSFIGTEAVDTDDFSIKIAGRLDRKVDVEILRDIAEQHGLTDKLPTLFRWKAEVNIAEWKQANEAEISVFSRAITSKPGRPSFEIMQKNKGMKEDQRADY